MLTDLIIEAARDLAALTLFVVAVGLACGLATGVI